MQPQSMFGEFHSYMVEAQQMLLHTKGSLFMKRDLPSLNMTTYWQELFYFSSILVLCQLVSYRFTSWDNNYFIFIIRIFIISVLTFLQAELLDFTKRINLYRINTIIK